VGLVRPHGGARCITRPIGGVSQIYYRVGLSDTDCILTFSLG